MNEIRSVESIIQDILSSKEGYIYYQRDRILYTISLVKNLHLLDNAKDVLNVGGGDWDLFTELWHATFPHIEWHDTTGDLHNPLEFANESFDMVLCTEVFEHIGDRNFKSSSKNFEGITQLTQEIARVLKTGGRCLMTTPNVASYLNISLILRGTHPFMYPLHYREYTRYEIETILNAIGVNIIYFDSYSVFMCDEKVIKTIRQILEFFKLPTQDRGDDFFIVFQKPYGFKYKEIVYPGLVVYPEMRREPIIPVSIFTDTEFLLHESANDNRAMDNIE